VNLLSKILLLLLLPGLAYASDRQPPGALPEQKGETKNLTVTVASVGRGSDGQPVVLLRAGGREEVLPIFVGPSEAVAIVMEMAHLRPPRPMTHDLLKDAIETLGGHVSGIVITELREGTFYARVLIERNGEKLSVDARPSDSIALALRCTAPITVSEELFDRESIALPPESETPRGQPEEPAEPVIPNPPRGGDGNLTI